MLSRKQIERAERTAEMLGQKQLLTQFRRMDEYDHQRKLVDSLVDNTDHDLKMAQLRLTEYGRQARKFEKYRQEAVAFLIREGLVKADPAWLAAETYEKPKDLKRIPNTVKKFTERQMELAMASLDKPKPAVEYGA